MIEIDTTPVAEMIRGLQQIEGGDFEPIMRNVVGSVIALCVKWTPAAKASSIRKSVKVKNSRVNFKGGDKYSENIQPGKTGSAWLVDESTWDQCKWGKGNKKGVQGSTTKPTHAAGGRVFHLIASNRRWSDKRWAKVMEMQALLVSNRIDPEAAVKSRGLSKLTWVQIADSLGIQLDDVPDYVRNAGTFRGKPAPVLGIGQRVQESAGVYFDISNLSRILSGERVDGAAMLQRAINTRYKAFMTDMKHGVFDNIEARARRYPGIFTN